MTHLLAQSETQLFQEFLRIVGGGSIAALLSAGIWALITGKLFPKWYGDHLNKLLDAERAAKDVERLARIAAEARLDQTIKTLNELREAYEALQSPLVDALQKIARTEAVSRQEGPKP